MTAPVLVGDIGGTHARFALANIGSARPVVREARTVQVADFATPEDALEAYLDGRERPRAVVLAVAGTITDGRTRMTNADWSLDEGRLREAGFGRALLVNDFIAQAWAAPLLGRAEVRSLGGPETGQADGTIAVLGPGTGFGLSALAHGAAGSVALATEGGHTAFAPHDAVEVALLNWFGRRYGRVSVERLLSGRGLADLHLALAEIEGRTLAPVEPADVTREALAGEPAAVATVERFCAILGGVAGDAALVLGARGGVFVTGGIAPRIADLLDRSEFRARFEAKGRFRAYAAAIPTWLVTRSDAALLGAAETFRRMGGDPY